MSLIKECGTYFYFDIGYSRWADFPVNYGLVHDIEPILDVIGLGVVPFLDSLLCWTISCPQRKLIS